MVKMPVFPVDNVDHIRPTDIRPSNRACRCLFGVPDRAELQETLRKERDEQLEGDKQKWGFDFTTEQPIPGSKYQWTRATSSAGDISQQQHQVIFTGKRKADVFGDLAEERGFKVVVTEQSENECDTNDNAESSQNDKAEGESSPASPSTSRQSKVTDYFPVRKCPSPDKSDKH